MKSYCVMKEIHFCYGHRLLNYDGKCKNLHGHNGRAQIELSASQCDKRGMVVDFGDIESILQQWIDHNLDHKLLLCEKDPLIKALQKLKQPLFVMKENPTAEAIAKLIFETAQKHKLPVSQVRLWETPSSYASYKVE